jgi:hypothetical protein
MQIIIPKITLTRFLPKRRGTRLVFRMFKKLDNGSFLIAGMVYRYPTRYRGYKD